MKTTDRQGRPAVQEHDPGPRARGRLDQLLLIDNVPSLDQDRHSAHRRNPPGTVSGGCRPLALGPPHRNLVSGFWTGSAATSARRWSGPGPAWQASGVKQCHGVETDHGRHNAVRHQKNPRSTKIDTSRVVRPYTPTRVVGSHPKWRFLMRSGAYLALAPFRGESAVRSQLMCQILTEVISQKEDRALRH